MFTSMFRSRLNGMPFAESEETLQEQKKLYVRLGAKQKIKPPIKIGWVESTPAH